MLRQLIARSAKALGKLPASNNTTQRALLHHSAVPKLSYTQACTCRNLKSRAWQQSRSVASIRSFHSSASSRQTDVPEISSLTDRRYHEIADDTMDTLVDRLEALQEEIGDADFDVEYSSGVLTVKLPNGKGTYVINKQPPNKQIWLSSPTSGPKRYDYSEETEAWFYTRDGSQMVQLLEEELSEKLAVEVKFS